MLTAEGWVVMLALPLVGGVVLSLVVIALTTVAPPIVWSAVHAVVRQR
jgi:hypothetical protein